MTLGARLQRYYDESLPLSSYAPVVPATGATAGIPGAWTPSGSQPPATVADLGAGVPNAVTATPATAWTTGQFVQTATPGAAGRATWTGTAWVGGTAPLTQEETMSDTPTPEPEPTEPEPEAPPTEPEPEPTEPE